MIYLGIDHERDSFFYTSGLISLSFYLLFFLFFILYIKSSDIKKIDAFSKETVLELDIITPEKKKIIQKKKRKANKFKEKNKDISKKVVKKSASVSAKKSTNLKSLFAKVSTKTGTVAKKQVLNIKASKVSSRYKSKFEKQKRSQNVAISKLVDSKSTVSKSKVSAPTAKNKDAYYSQIYEILYSRWRPQSIGLAVKALITITSNGSFEYKIIQYSGNSLYDDSLIRFLEKQKSIEFPPFLEGRQTDIEITFKSKD